MWSRTEEHFSVLLISYWHEKSNIIYRYSILYLYYYVTKVKISRLEIIINSIHYFFLPRINDIMNGESSYNLFRKPRNLWCFIVILTIDRVWTQCREDTQCPGDQICLVEPQSSNFKFEVIILSIVILKRVM